MPSGLKCKGERPALLPVILDAAAKERAKQARNKQPGGRIYNEIQDLKENSSLRKNAEEKTTDEPKMEDGEDEETLEPLPLEPDFSKGPIAPKYSLVYSYPTTIGDFHNKADIMAPAEKQSPSEIKLRIELPKAESAEDLKVDLKPNSFQLEFKSLYYLSLDFLVEVNVENAKAKFVSSKRFLEIILPVVKKELPAPQKIAPVEESEDRIEDESKDDLHISPIGTDDHSKDPISEATDVKRPITEPPEGEVQQKQEPEAEPEATAHHEEDRTSELERPATQADASARHRLEFDFLLKPQVTYLQSLHIYLLHLPKYEPSQIDLLVGEDKLLVTYSHQAFTQYVLLKAEGRSSFKAVEVEKQHARDYFGFRLVFRSSEDAEAARECFKVQTEVEVFELEQIQSDLHLDRLRREEIQRLAREVAIQEVEPQEGETVETALASSENQSRTLPNEPESSIAANQEIAGEESHKESTEITKNQEPSVEESHKLRPKEYGWQLLELEMLSYACQLD